MAKIRVTRSEKLEEKAGDEPLNFDDGTSLESGETREIEESVTSGGHSIPELIEAGWLEEVPEEEEGVSIAELEKPSISSEQNRKIHAQYRELGWEEPEKRAYLEKFGVEHTNELTRDQAADAIEDLSERTEEREVVAGAPTGEGAGQAAVQEEAPRREIGLLRPAGSPEEAKAVMEEFKEIIEGMLDKRPTQEGGDIMYIAEDGSATTNPGEAVNQHITRSGLRKIALASDLDMETIDREKIESRDGKGEYYVWRFTVRVRHPGGRIMVRDGACTSRDPFYTKGGEQPADEANIMLKAETVAYNRAILDLVGAPKMGREAY